jgi:hypothetical protein
VLAEVTVLDHGHAGTSAFKATGQNVVMPVPVPDDQKVTWLGPVVLTTQCVPGYFQPTIEYLTSVYQIWP